MKIKNQVVNKIEHDAYTELYKQAVLAAEQAFYALQTLEQHKYAPAWLRTITNDAEMVWGALIDKD